jgi:hypothetical protein
VTTDDFERSVRATAAEWVFIRWVTTTDKTAHAIKMRLHLTEGCFVQIYANIEKDLLSYALVLERERIYGRDSEGGRWHRHPYGAAETHDLSSAGARAIDLPEFLAEVQQILEDAAIL